jgi:TetR/AcrR family transcriptional repressor of nem operon
VSDTRERLLDVAERLTQTKGFNGFSYLDLADEVGIKNSSIHYHFNAKVDLAIALVERTHNGLLAAFAELDSSNATPEKRIKSIISYFQGYIKDEK